MKNIWIQRSLASVAVAGALTLAGGTAAYADDNQQDTTNQSNGSLSLPIEIGGITLGSSSESSSSSSSTTTTTDGDESSTDTQGSQQHSSSSGGLSTGPITLDPGVALSSGSKSHQDSDDGDRSSESSSQSSGSAKSPLHVGGLQVEQHQSNAGAEETTNTDTDGDESSTDHSATTDSSSSDAGLGLGALDVAPQGGFGQAQQDSAATDDEDGTDKSASATALTEALPFSFEGIWGVATTTQDATSTDSQSDTDGDESTTSTETDSSHQDTTVGGAVGASSGNPSLDLGAVQSGAGSQDGDDNADESSGRASGGYDAPFGSEGFSGLLEHGTSSQHGSAETTRDGDESTTEQETSSDASRHVVPFDFEGLFGHPAGDLSTDDLTSSTEER